MRPSEPERYPELAAYLAELGYDSIVLLNGTLSLVKADDLENSRAVTDEEWAKIKPLWGISD